MSDAALNGNHEETMLRIYQAKHQMRYGECGSFYCLFRDVLRRQCCPIGGREGLTGAKRHEKEQ